jgi:hypothetical protein
MKTTIRSFHWQTWIICLLSVFFINGSWLLSAQDTLSNGKALNFPFKRYGISIGNSYEFNGIRINLVDKNVKRINGLNVTFWFKNHQKKISALNGINVGVFPYGGSMQPINLGILGVATEPKNLNGLSFGGLFVIGAGGNINGLSLSGINTGAEGKESKISGIAISGLSIWAGKSINGLAIGGLGVWSLGDINGISSSLAYLSGKQNFRGIGATLGYLEAKTSKGLTFAGYTKTTQMYGLSIALFNRAEKLHGIQLGLLNYAGNNRKGLRMLPFVNLHLGKNKNGDKIN